LSVRNPRKTGDANTGAAINANFITGLNEPGGLALSADGTALFVANSGTNAVGKYNATSGAAININFITGLSAPAGVALSADDTALFVAGNTFFAFATVTVGKYNAATGAAINTNLITVLGGNSALALSGDGTTLFVPTMMSLETPTTVGEYNAITGAVINANFITGLINPVGLTLSGDDTSLFVGNNSTGTVGKHNATTGAAINTNFINTGPTTNGNFTTRGSGPTALAVSGNDLFVGGFPIQGPPFTVALPGEGLGTVSKYDATMGVAINANFITGVDIGPQLAVAPTPPPQLQPNNSCGKIQSRASTVSGSCTTAYRPM
jgi:hypothetical protein